MKALHCIIPVVIISALIYTSCEPFEKISEVPEIHFKSYTPYQLYWITSTDTTIIKAGELVFSFIDGDADFGIDTTLRYADTINFFLNAYQKVGGVYDSVDANIYGRRYKILDDPKMNRTGGNTTIKGEIKLQIYYFRTPPFDTIRYEFYIVDRAEHKSNVESTTDIAF
jgi:hypothetical protein